MRNSGVMGPLGPEILTDQVGHIKIESLKSLTCHARIQMTVQALRVDGSVQLGTFSYKSLLGSDQGWTFLITRVINGSV